MKATGFVMIGLLAMGCGDDGGKGTDVSRNASGTGEQDAGPMNGRACDNAADKAVLDRVAQAHLGCLGGVCVMQNLKGASIDEAGTAACMAAAPDLGDLSDGCRACFLRITLCVPSKCSLLGRNPACSGVPSTDFASCDAPPPQVSEECTQCQEMNCTQDFLDCSGIGR